MKKSAIEPYRMFFITGTLLSFIGAFVWVLFYYNKISYPAIQHPSIMMGGFLLSFICGFLMTAAPKFTASFPMTEMEKTLSIVLNIGLVVAAIFYSEPIFFLSSFVIFIFLTIYFLRRFANRTQNLPPAFIFMGAGLGLGLLSSVSLFLSYQISFSLVFLKLVKLFYFQGYVLSLIIGVGSRLLPALLGHSAGIISTEGTQVRDTRRFLMLMILFISSYLLEVFIDGYWGSLLKIFVVLYVAISFWKIHKLPIKRTRSNWGLIISAWMLLIGLVGSLWAPYRIHFLHLFFIGGMGLMTFMIAIRVVLAHGAHDLMLEVKSRSIPWIISLFAFSGITRLSAGFLPRVYLSHLIYAALIWCIGVALWFSVFLPKILKRGR